MLLIRLLKAFLIICVMINLTGYCFEKDWEDLSALTEIKQDLVSYMIETKQTASNLKTAIEAYIENLENKTNSSGVYNKEVMNAIQKNYNLWRIVYRNFDRYNNQAYDHTNKYLAYLLLETFLEFNKKSKVKLDLEMIMRVGILESRLNILGRNTVNAYESVDICLFQINSINFKRFNTNEYELRNSPRKCFMVAFSIMREALINCKCYSCFHSYSPNIRQVYKRKLRNILVY